MKPWAEQFHKSKGVDRLQRCILYQPARYLPKTRCWKIVHHKIALTPENINDPNITLNWENLELLCQDCHNKEHSCTDVTAEGLAFDENGDLIAKQHYPPIKNKKLYPRGPEGEPFENPGMAGRGGGDRIIEVAQWKNNQRSVEKERIKQT